MSDEWRSAAAMRREREETAERRSPQVKRRSSAAAEEEEAWMTEIRPGFRRAARSNKWEMQQGSSADIPPLRCELGLRASGEGEEEANLKAET